jgi:type II secretion system protein I
MLLPVSKPRSGLSLLESLVATAIMFIAFTAIYSLIDGANRQARIVREQSLAMQVCQSTLNEVMAGSLPLSGQSGDCGDNLPGWEWSIESQPHEVQGLHKVRIVVKRTDREDAETQAVLEQFVLDPAKRGSVMDIPPPAATASSTTEESGSSTTQPSTTQPSTTKPSTTKPSTTQPSGTQPKTGGTRPSGR